jgi:hypothetical protein
MTMPGFTAEAALDRTPTFYRALARYARAGDGLQPATIHCNPTCLDNCLMDCSDCDDLPVKFRAACIRACLQHNVRCRRMCCH